MPVSLPLLDALLTGTLEAAIDACLTLAPNRLELLEPLIGKVVALRLQPFGGAWYFCSTDARLQVLREISGTPDVTLSGSVFGFARLRLGGSVRESLARGEIEMEGDSEVARHFQNLIDRLPIDWEALLARYTGARFASGGFDLLRSGTSWTRETVDTLHADLAEFWQEETRDLPARSEAEAFLKAVDTLRADCDRLEARLVRLENLPKAVSSG